jgi:cytochrome c
MVMVRVLLGTAVLLVASPLSLWAEGGADVFKNQCAKCHGDAGKSDTAVAKKMKIPPIAGDAKLAAMGDDDLAKQILGAEKHPKSVKSMSAGDAASLAAFVKQLAGSK